MRFILEVMFANNLHSGGKGLAEWEGVRRLGKRWRGSSLMGGCPVSRLVGTGIRKEVCEKRLLAGRHSSERVATPGNMPQDKAVRNTGKECRWWSTSP